MDTLTRSSLTPAARSAMPAFVFLTTVLGANYIITPAHRLRASPALAYGDRLMPLPLWGALFLICAAFMVTAMVLSGRTWSRPLFAYALWLTASCQGLWAVVFAVAAINSVASPAAWAWPAFVVWMALALERSLRFKVER